MIYNTWVEYGEHMHNTMAFCMAWDQGGWVNTWSCESYESMTGLPTPQGTPVANLPFLISDMNHIDDCLSKLLRNRRSKSPVTCRWHYPYKGEIRPFDNIIHPTKFDGNGFCCEAFGIAAPTETESSLFEKEVITRWLIAQPNHLLDYLVNYASFSLQGENLRVGFTCEPYVRVMTCQLDEVVQPPDLPHLTVSYGLADFAVPPGDKSINAEVN